VLCIEGRKSAYMDLVVGLKKINLLEDLDIGWRMMRYWVFKKDIEGEKTEFMWL
jgi:hypothetical protein